MNLSYFEDWWNIEFVFDLFIAHFYRSIFCAKDKPIYVKCISTKGEQLALNKGTRVQYISVLFLQHAKEKDEGMQKSPKQPI